MAALYCRTGRIEEPRLYVMADDAIVVRSCIPLSPVALNPATPSVGTGMLVASLEKDSMAVSSSWL